MILLGTKLWMTMNLNLLYLRPQEMSHQFWVITFSAWNIAYDTPDLLLETTSETLMILKVCQSTLHCSLLLDQAHQAADMTRS